MNHYYYMDSMHVALRELGERFRIMGIAAARAHVQIGVFSIAWNRTEQAESRTRVLEWEGIWLWH